MLPLNFYKIRTGLDIRPKAQGGDDESQLRYDQILQIIDQKAQIEYINNNVLEVIEKSPADLGAYRGTQLKVYVIIFAVNKDRSAWTASELTQTLGNMYIPSQVKRFNDDAAEWIGGEKNNISCEAAFFDLRTRKKLEKERERHTARKSKKDI
jgi:hypothetical protein